MVHKLMETKDWVSLIKINPRSTSPIYQKIGDNLKNMIERGEVEPGEMLPSEWELSRMYSTSRLTVRRALDDLVREGLLTRRQGVGTFVASQTRVQILPSELSFTQNMRKAGRNPSSQVVKLTTQPATQVEAQALNLAAGYPVYELVRVRLVDGEPLMLETTYLSQQRFPDLGSADLEHGSLYEYLLQHYRIAIVAMDQSMEPMLLDKQEAALLDVAPNSPGIRSEITGYSEDGEPIEHTWSVTCHGRGKFYFYFREGALGTRHVDKS